MKVVEAYSVLGKEKERRLYDLQTGIKTDPEQFQTGEAGEAKKRQGWRPMSFEERVKAYGFPEQVMISGQNVCVVFMKSIFRILTFTKSEEITIKRLWLPV